MPTRFLLPPSTPTSQGATVRRTLSTLSLRCIASLLWGQDSWLLGQYSGVPYGIRQQAATPRPKETPETRYTRHSLDSSSCLQATSSFEPLTLQLWLLPFLISQGASREMS